MVRSRRRITTAKRRGAPADIIPRIQSRTPINPVKEIESLSSTQIF